MWKQFDSLDDTLIYTWRKRCYVQRFVSCIKILFSLKSIVDRKRAKNPLEIANRFYYSLLYEFSRYLEKIVSFRVERKVHIVPNYLERLHGKYSEKVGSPSDGWNGASVGKMERFFLVVSTPSALSSGTTGMQSSVISHTAVWSPGGGIGSIGAMCSRHCTASDAPDAILVKAVCPCWQVGELCMRTCRNQARLGYVSCS